MNKRLNNLIFVWLIMLLTTMMSIMPLPDFLYGIRIEWVAMAVVYPDWQIMIVTLFLLSFGNLISLWIRGFSGRILFVAEEWISIFIAALIWPVFMRVLQALQNYFVED